MDVTLRGQVVGGRGHARPLLERTSGEVEALLGERVYPGTLNLVLTRPVRLRSDTALRFDGKRMLWPASIDGFPVWLYRWPGARLHVVEVVARELLRDRFGLSDGSAVVVTVASEHVAALSPHVWPMWALIWLGRRRWYYHRDGYQRRVKRAEVRLRLLQRH